MNQESLFGNIAAAAPAMATFSPCRAYRYTLTREITKLGRAGRVVAFVLLNPSTADESTDDPTIRRLIDYARRWRVVDALIVVNIFALRSTDPSALKAARDPIGPENDATILATAARAELVIVGWGKHGALHGRGPAVLAMLRGAGIAPKCLATNKDSSPKHPLYLRGDLLPFDAPGPT